MWVYLQSTRDTEPDPEENWPGGPVPVFTVGFYDPAGEFVTSPNGGLTFHSRFAAEKRVNYLNGGAGADEGCAPLVTS